MAFPSNKRSVDKRKLRGGYYTPLNLARYLVQWGLRESTTRILEPSCGDGNFIMALHQHLLQENGNQPPVLVAVEIERKELEKAKTRVRQITPPSTLEIEWIPQDFFRVFENLERNQFDLIIGNPPFIRFQYFEEESRAIAFRHLRRLGYHPTKLANVWAAFVQLSIELLADGGCLAMVVPAELLQVKYARELREQLVTQFNHIVLVSFEKIVFPEIQQEVLLLLAEGKQSEPQISNIHTIEFRDGHTLNARELNNTIAHTPSRHSRPGMKWTSLFLEQSLFAALDEAEQAEGLVPLGELAQVNVGIVTGRNRFFVLTEEQQEALQATDLTTPIIGRTSALKSVVFDREAFAAYKSSYPAFLLRLQDVAREQLPKELQDYLALGEQEGVHRGYKCRIRNRWFDVPSIYVPDAFLFRQIHNYPLLVLNKAQVTSTDTIHRVRLGDQVDPIILAATFFNSLTLAWAEVCGRSYGGGVLELEPKEAEELPIPYNPNVEIDLEKVDTLLSRDRSLEALDYVDQIVLKDFLGFDSLLVKKVRAAWEQLRDRRKNRNHS
ncbi:MAG: class I SAM-dependent methyltransferase [Chloroflexia bacterium]|nr:class I SAM-dependent methyltransferase [Chloroflexia bacterium]